MIDHSSVYTLQRNLNVSMSNDFNPRTNGANRAQRKETYTFTTFDGGRFHVNRLCFCRAARYFFVIDEKINTGVRGLAASSLRLKRPHATVFANSYSAQ